MPLTWALTLHLSPRPARAHTRTASKLGAFLVTTFDVGGGGPGGWTILFEPELHLGSDILVPDLAGWRAGRLVDAKDVDEPYITVVPDWVCEILSPGISRIDRMKKVPICARESVAHLWLVDPRERVIEVFRHDGSGYLLVGTYGGDEGARAEPFESVEIPKAFLWG